MLLDLEPDSDDRIILPLFWPDEIEEDFDDFDLDSECWECEDDDEEDEEDLDEDDLLPLGLFPFVPLLLWPDECSTC